MDDAARTVVRPARPEDEEAVHRHAAAMATSFVVDRDGFRSTYGAVLAAPGAVLLVAVVDGVVVGYVLGFLHPAFYAGGTVAWVEEIAVDPSLRRRRIGADLMAHVERRAREDGARLVALATRRAEHFYAALGYEASATYFRKVL